MYNGNFQNDFNEAVKRGSKITDILTGLFKKGKVIHIENLHESIADLLDKYSGIDAIYFNELDLAGVALRIQQNSNKNWETFTIRYKRITGTETEYSKRIRQIFAFHPSFYPHYTCQAYLSDDNKLIGGGVCYTSDLFKLAKESEPFNNNPALDIYLNTNSKDGNEFLVVKFCAFKNNNLRLLTF